MKLTLDATTRRKLIAARGSRSLRDVAETLPISYAQLLRIEQGKSSVDKPTLEAIAKVLGLRVRIKTVRTETFDLVSNQRA